MRLNNEGKDRIIVALDVDEAEHARELVKELTGSVGMFKVGSQLFTSQGPGLVRDIIAGGGRVFLDLKYHDIPNTVGHAASVAGRLGASLLTVHGLGGTAMIQAAVKDLPPETRVLAITVLTSHDEASLEQLGLGGPVADAVRRLALLARDAGAHGVVCSPHEARLIREACGPDLLIVTPGIRPAGSQKGDQARVATPASALAAGANHLVVGRPITAAKDPRAAAEAIAREIEGARG